MAIEKVWPVIPAQSITSNGTSDGHITVSDSTLFFVKRKVTVFSDDVSPMTLEVKRINNIHDMELGKVGDINNRVDLTSILLVDNPMISAEEEQPRPSISMEDVIRASYANEPAVALRNLLVSELGDAIDTDNPLPIATSPIWDEIDLTYDINQNLQTVTYLKNGNAIVLTLHYDSNLNLTSVTKS